MIPSVVSGSSAQLSLSIEWTSDFFTFGSNVENASRVFDCVETKPGALLSVLVRLLVCFSAVANGCAAVSATFLSFLAETGPEAIFVTSSSKDSTENSSGRYGMVTS